MRALARLGRHVRAGLGGAASNPVVDGEEAQVRRSRATQHGAIAPCAGAQPEAQAASAVA